MAREVLELADYNYKIYHLKGRENRRANALSQQPEYDQGDRDNENVTVLPDAVFAQLGATEGGEQQDEEVIHRWVDPHQLKKIGRHWEKNRWWVVTGDSTDKQKIIAAHHDPSSHSHLGISHTLELVGQMYWWPHIKQDITDYVWGCAKCQ